MFCDSTACDQAGDRINIIINDNVNEDIIENSIMTIDYSNIGQQIVWQKMSLNFTTITSNIQVISVCYYGLFFFNLIWVSKLQWF